MINHARTLLGNLTMLDDPQLGGEYIPRDYIPRKLPLPLQRIRELLFGAKPDRAFINQRLRHYMTLLHATELAQFVTDLDPRITYLPMTDKGWFTERCRITHTQQGPPCRVFVAGKLEADLAAGQSQYGWRVAVQDANTILVRRRHGQYEDHVHTIDATTLSPALPLPDSGLTIRVGTKQAGSDLSELVGARIYVDGIARATTDLPAITLRLMSLTSVVAGGLFGPDEPYKTFRNLWLTHPELPYRLGGLLLALIYRMNELQVRA